MEGEVIVNRTTSPSRQKGMRLRTQVKGLPLVIALLVLLVTFWPCRSCAHLPRMQLAGGWGLLFIKELVDIEEVSMIGQRRFWAHMDVFPSLI